MAALLIDLDGVVYQGDQALAGAVQVVEWLTGQQIPHLFVTNTTSRPRSELVAKLQGFGLSIAAQEILTPPVAACAWLRAQGVSRVALLVPDATRSEFDEFEQLPATAEEGAEAVVIGDFGQAWNFAVMNRAFRQLMQDRKPHLVALGMTHYWQASDGLRLDTAPFVVALAHASGVEPRVLGKPAPAFFAAALSMLDATAAQAWMIGDDIRADVGGAQGAGLRGILVRTGKFRADDIGGEIKPDAIIDSFAALPAWWDAHASSV